jgi:hypothetical protein
MIAAGAVLAWANRQLSAMSASVEEEVSRHLL